nr:reverse transcriptase N-terminal domain-containing protein [Shigella sonnei]
MNTHISVSTIPHLTGWHAINWKACHARVRKLQLRIAKATRQQQWRQVRELQRILTRSFSGALPCCKHHAAGEQGWSEGLTHVNC